MVGNGLNIRLGVDPIAGLNAQYLLFEDLRDYLADLGITKLAQAQNLEVYGHEFNCWYTASYLNLGDDWVLQWSTYVKFLSHGGIRIGNSEDTLLWMFEKKLGKVTAKMAYDLIVSK